MMHEPLSYCTNVHPCRSLNDVGRMLADQATAVRDQCGFEIAVGLWLPAAAMADVAADPGAIDRLRGWLAEHRFSCHTLNAFPFGDFHSERVKEQVYLPDWADLRRLDYTRSCSRLLAGTLTAEPADGQSRVASQAVQAAHQQVSCIPADNDHR